VSILYETWVGDDGAGGGYINIKISLHFNDKGKGGDAWRGYIQFKISLVLKMSI
jgi:hypothetical protein